MPQRPARRPARPAAPVPGAAPPGGRPMRLTRATAYAVNALARLAAARSPAPTARGPPPPAGAPGDSLAKALRPLAQARLLVSVKGPSGVYARARPAARITLLEILEAVEGPLDNHCAAPPSADPALDRRLDAACRGAAEALRRRLAKVRLSDLRDGAGRMTTGERKGPGGTPALA